VCLFIHVFEQINFVQNKQNLKLSTAGGFHVTAALAVRVLLNFDGGTSHAGVANIGVHFSKNSLKEKQNIERRIKYTNW
jgi:hypothetical protein